MINELCKYILDITSMSLVQSVITVTGEGALNAEKLDKTSGIWHGHNSEFWIAVALRKSLL